MLLNPVEPYHVVGGSRGVGRYSPEAISSDGRGYELATWRGYPSVRRTVIERYTEQVAVCRGCYTRTGYGGNVGRLRGEIAV